MELRGREGRTCSVRSVSSMCESHWEAEFAAEWVNRAMVEDETESGSWRKGE